MVRSCLLILIPVWSGFGFAAENACPNKENIQIFTNDIFNLNDPETIWIHRLANMLHVVTREETIANEIAFLRDKCHISERDLQEAERHLRKLKYVNTASAVRQDDNAIAIITSDKWSLMPTVDFGRKGGQNKYSFGIKDRNLLGWGVDAEIEYFKDVQRSGYIFDTHFPLYTGNNIRGSITLTDTDDGSAQGVSIVRPFVSFDTDNAFAVTAYSGDLRQQYFLNGQDYYELGFSDRQASASWGRLYQRQADAVYRYTIGADYSKRTFTDVVNTASPVPDFQNREYLVPYIQFDYLEDDFRELSNVHVINQIEDFNLGWQLTTKLGVNVASRDNAESLFVISMQAAKGTQLNPDTLLLSDLSLTSNIGSTHLSHHIVELNNELFYNLSPRFGLYGGQHLTLTKNPYIDEPVTIGEDSGVRGYPLEFQRGTSKLALTGEVRYYPDINIYNLFDVGAAAFVDTGRVYGTGDFAPQTEQWLSSVGIGARFYSRHASDTKVIHLDVSFPMLKDENVNNVEFLITTKSSF